MNVKELFSILITENNYVINKIDNNNHTKYFL